MSTATMRRKAPPPPPPSRDSTWWRLWEALWDSLFGRRDRPPDALNTLARHNPRCGHAKGDECTCRCEGRLHGTG